MASTVTIDIFRITNGKHSFNFQLGEEFFEPYGQEIFRLPRLELEVLMDKSETMVVCQCKASGVVTLICDRSLEAFEFPIQVSQRLVYKYGDTPEEIDDELSVIEWNTQKLNMSQAVYDFIALSVPMKKTHPRFGEANTEGDLLVYSTEPEEEEDQKESEEIDPRWAQLLQLKGNINGSNSN